jgi:DDE superfamily endonuclease
VLIYQDEMEIHRHPHLTRMWALVGQQPKVPAPGKNEKKVVYGGVDYRTGKLTYTLADTKCGTAFLVFLMTLLATYAGQKIRLVCDNGRFHTTCTFRQKLRSSRQREQAADQALEFRCEIAATLSRPKFRAQTAAPQGVTAVGMRRTPVRVVPRLVSTIAQFLV